MSCLAPLAHRAAIALAITLFATSSSNVSLAAANFCTYSFSGQTLFKWPHCSMSVRPNNSFKPNLLRYSKTVA